MPEANRTPTPSTALYPAPSTLAQSQQLERAKIFNHQSGAGVPADWAFNASGQIVSRSTGRPIAVGPPIESNFWKELAHASPYIALAIGLGFIPGAGAVGGGAGAGLGVGGVEGGAYGLGADAVAGLGTGAMGAVPVGAGVGTGLAGTAGAAGPSGVGAGGGAAETGLLPSTTTVPTASTGLPTGSSWTSAGGGINTARGIGSYLDTAGDVANAFGGISAGRQQGRNAENFANYNFDRAQQDQYRTQVQANANENDFGLGRARLGLDTSTAANNFALNRVGAGINLSDADLRQQQFSLDAPKARARNSVQGDILANAKDVSISGLPSTIPNISINGGLRPSMFSDNTRALGGLMSQQALDSQRKGDVFKPLPDLPNYQGPTTGLPDYVQPPKAPGVTPPVQATGVDSFLNNAGGILSLAGLFSKYFRK